MNACERATAAMHLYVDGELETADALALEAHLLDCAECRDKCESLMNVVGSVRAMHPLYSVPSESYEKARRQIHDHRQSRVARLAALATLAALAAVGSWMAYAKWLQPRTSLAAFAANTHLRYSRGLLLLDIRSQDPGVVGTWLGQRLPFRVALSDSPDPGGSRPYSLVGARLLQYGDRDAGYVTYEVGGRPVSLLIAVEGPGGPARGFAQKIGRLTFYTTSQDGLSAISWVDQRLSYALVSEPGRPGSESCVICHGGAKERQKFAPLKSPL